MKTLVLGICAAAVVAAGSAGAQAEQDGAAAPMMQQGGGEGMHTTQAGRDPGMMGERGMMGHGGMGPNMMTIMMVMIDTDGSGTLSLEEVQAVHARMFQYADSDDDGELTPQELRGFMSGGGDSSPR